MNKHQLKVVPFAGWMPSKKITLRCAHCVVYLEVDREAMEAILLKGDRRLENIPFNTFGNCAGA